MLRNFALVAALATTAGCYAEMSDSYYGGATLSYVAPDVSVVAGYDYPVFYSNNNFWMYNSGVWYRSPYYDRGWVYATPPVALRGIANPYAYVHYRHPSGAYYGHRGSYGPTYHGPVYHGGGPYHGTYNAGGYGRHR